MGWNYYTSIEMNCSHEDLYLMLPLIYKNTHRLETLYFHELYENGAFKGSRLFLSVDQYKGDFDDVGFRGVLFGIAKLFPDRPVIVVEGYDQTRRTHFVIAARDVLMIDEDDMGTGEITFEKKETYGFGPCLDEAGKVCDGMSIYNPNAQLEIVHSDNDLFDVIKESFLNDPDIQKIKEVLFTTKGETATSPELPTFPQP